MTKNHRIGALTLAIAALAFASNADAQSINANVNVNGSLKVPGVTATATTKATGTMRAEEARENGAYNAGTNANVNAQINASSNSAVAQGSATTSAEVQAYADSVKASDEHVEKVEAKSDKVSVSYAAKAKLFGLIPITSKVTAVAKADGSVEIDHPWYAFLSAEDATAIKADVMTATDGTIDADGTLTVSEQKRLIDALKVALMTSYQARVTAEANASTSTK